jgi:hypothetical protein
MAELFWLSDLQWAAILHHELNSFLGGAGHERLLLPKDLVVFLRGRVGPSEPGDDDAVRELLLPLPIRLDRDIVAENGAQIVELAFLVGDGDQPPVAVTREHFDPEDRGGLIIARPGSNGINAMTHAATAAVDNAIRCLMAVSDIATFSGMEKTPLRVGVRLLVSTASHLL